MKEKLLIINQRQFGYHSDTYYYCKYLRPYFEITYICWDYHDPRIHMDRVRVVYLSRDGSLPVRNLRFIKSVAREITNGQYHIHMIKYFRGCSLLRLLNPHRLFLFDIRSGSIVPRKASRIIYNRLMSLEARCFRHVSVISNSLSRQLGLGNRAFVLPIGADILTNKPKTFTRMHLLYVGTLYNRNMALTLRGFSRFYHEYRHQIDIRYTIIGSGYGREVENLKALAGSEGVSDRVGILGKIPHKDIRPYFDGHNIGVSFIPKTEYFNVQPPTKTFEYLLSGMPVLATDTLENKLAIAPGAGVLIDDTSDGVYRGLTELYENLGNFDSDRIRRSAAAYTWDKITREFTRRLKYIITTRKG